MSTILNWMSEHPVLSVILFATFCWMVIGIFHGVPA
jgi:hypothetical protein